MSPRFIDTNILLYSISRDPAEASKRDIAIALLDAENIALSVQERRHELPRRWGGPRASHDPWIRRYMQKLIEYSPGCVPGIRPRALALKPVTTGA